MLIGYARVSTAEQNLAAQRDAIFFDHGLTGTNRARQASEKRWPPAGQGTRS